MRHLYASRAEVLRLSGVMSNGLPALAWGKIEAVADPALGVEGELLLRLDLQLMRPGKDQPMPVVVGRAPDRIGVAFYDATDVVKAGDRLHMIAGPVTGTFEIRAVPDPAVAMAATHHMEVQVIEVAQTNTGVFPGGALEEF